MSVYPLDYLEDKLHMSSFSPFGRSHRPEALSPLDGENDICF